MGILFTCCFTRLPCTVVPFLYKWPCMVLCRYQWVHVPAFERGNVATVVLVQNVSGMKAFVS